MIAKKVLSAQCLSGNSCSTEVISYDTYRSLIVEHKQVEIDSRAMPNRTIMAVRDNLGKVCGVAGVWFDRGVYNLSLPHNDDDIIVFDVKNRKRGFGRELLRSVIGHVVDSKTESDALFYIILPKYEALGFYTKILDEFVGAGLVKKHQYELDNGWIKVSL